eukprot:gene33200-40169_t
MVLALQHGDLEGALSRIEDSLLELKTGFMQRNHGVADSNIDIAGIYFCYYGAFEVELFASDVNTGLLNDMGSYCLLNGSVSLGYKHLQRALKHAQSSYAGDQHLLLSVWGNLLVYHKLNLKAPHQGLALGGEILRSLNSLPIVPPRPPISRSPQIYGKHFIPYSLDKETLAYGQTHALPPYMLYPRFSCNYLLPIWRVCNLYLNIAIGGTRGLGEALVVLNEAFGVLCGAAPAASPLLVPMACTLLLDTALFILQADEWSNSGPPTSGSNSPPLGEHVKYVLKGGKDSLQRFLEEHIFSLAIFQDVKKGRDGGGAAGGVGGPLSIGWSTLHPKDLLLIVGILRYHGAFDLLQRDWHGRDGGLMSTLEALHVAFTMEELQGMLWKRQHSVHYREIFENYDRVTGEHLKYARKQVMDNRIYLPRCLLGVSLMDTGEHFNLNQAL